MNVWAGVWRMRRSEATAVLGLVGEWGPSEVKRQYRRLAAVAHPDVGGEAEAFRRVREAYELLEGSSSDDAAMEYEASSWDVGGGRGDYRMATGAMTYLAVEPDLLDHLADICSSWEGRITDLRRSAVRQLGWLVVGVVPIGAVISAAKAQRYASTGRRFLVALQTVKHGDGLCSAPAWDELGRTYVALLGLLDLERAAASVDLGRYSMFLARLEVAMSAGHGDAVVSLMTEAARFGTTHDLRNFVGVTAPSKSATQRLAYSMGRRVGSLRR